MKLDFDIMLNVKMMEYTKENNNFELHIVLFQFGSKINTP